jgi:transglutaminase-like putative cysteine protease
MLERLFLFLAMGVALFVPSPTSAFDGEKEPPAKPRLEITVDTSEVPELADWGKQARAVVEKWHPLIADLLPSPGFTAPTTVKLVFRKNMTGVAYTSGTTIVIAADWVKKHPDDLGMVVHELTHVIQAYRRGGPSWLVEGIADNIRFFHYEPQTKISINPRRASYRDSYRTTARFLDYVEKNHDKDIVRVLNEALRKGEYREELVKKRTGKTLDELWALFIASLMAENKEATPATTRTFLFTYATTLTDLPVDQMVRVWLPVPAASPWQEVEVVSQKLPSPGRIDTDSLYGNRILYLEAKPDAQGKLSLEIVYKIKRTEVRFDDLKETPEPAERLERYLQADALGPITGKPLELLEGRTLAGATLARSRQLYDLVCDTLRYSKEGQGWGKGDVVWVCESRFGNCTDFHSLFISLARAEKIPARYEVGFGLPEKHGEDSLSSYHCWAWFRDAGKGWIPVDISEANKKKELREYYFGNLTADRVAFSIGRDLTLTPRQNAGPVNYLIHPYVEVDGKPFPSERQQRNYRFKDLDQGQ